jgi:hypothetical protein
MGGIDLGPRRAGLGKYLGDAATATNIADGLMLHAASFGFDAW